MPIKPVVSKVWSRCFSFESFLKNDKYRIIALKTTLGAILLAGFVILIESQFFQVFFHFF